MIIAESIFQNRAIQKNILNFYEKIFTSFLTLAKEKKKVQIEKKIFEDKKCRKKIVNFINQKKRINLALMFLHQFSILFKASGKVHMAIFVDAMA